MTDERELNDADWEAEVRKAMLELKRQAYRERQQKTARRISPWVM